MNVQPKVVTQPQQPGVAAAAQPKTNIWQTDVCDCFSDCGVCLCGMFCFPCLSCQVATAMNECCCCGGTVAMRAVYRTKYNLPGTICGDTCIVACLPACSLCQVQRDIKKRQEMGIF